MDIWTDTSVCTSTSIYTRGSQSHSRISSLCVCARALVYLNRRCLFIYLNVRRDDHHSIWRSLVRDAHVPGLLYPPLVVVVAETVPEREAK